MSFSEESDHEVTNLQINSADLPNLQIPVDFLSDSSSESNFVTPPITTPSTPTTTMGTHFSFMGVSSQTSDDTDSTCAESPRTSKKKYKKKYHNRFKIKGSCLSSYSIKFPKPKRKRVEYPSSSLFQGVELPNEDLPLNVKVSDGEVIHETEVFVPSGNQIFNLQILSNVFSIFSCPVSNCLGHAKLYQQSLKDGLQRFFLVKCARCHFRIANFPATLPIGCSPKEAATGEAKLVKGRSEVNLQSMLAVHTTSLSWADSVLSVRC